MNQIVSILSKYEGIDPSLALLRESDAAIILDVHPGTLQNWRSSGKGGVPYVKLGGAIRYRLSELLRKLEESARTHTSDAQGGG
ncbi:MAG: helix-turn-helix domain-containing protein [Gammaproteobacteria bacterium]|nr:helix-turn-helix domain-containing protein [Gammaproteobacteria bacterium]